MCGLIERSHSDSFKMSVIHLHDIRQYQDYGDWVKRKYACLRLSFSCLVTCRAACASAWAWWGLWSPECSWHLQSSSDSSAGLYCPPWSNGKIAEWTNNTKSSVAKSILLKLSTSSSSFFWFSTSLWWCSSRWLCLYILSCFKRFIPMFGSMVI